MRAVIIGNGDIKDYDYISCRFRKNDFFICADGGLRHAKKLGIKPNILMGDFDSIEPDESIEILRFPVDKDYTDGELAISYAKEHGFNDVMLVGMTGSRIDHTITNILLMSRLSKAYLIDDKNDIYIIKDTISFEGYKGKTLSIIPVGGDLSGVCAKGFKWELRDECLKFGTSLGNSNLITADVCSISVKSGIGIIIISNGE